MKNLFLFVISIIFISLTSCKKKDKDHDDDHSHDVKNGVVSVKFDHLFGDQDFALNSDKTFQRSQFGIPPKRFQF